MKEQGENETTGPDQDQRTRGPKGLWTRGPRDQRSKGAGKDQRTHRPQGQESSRRGLSRNMLCLILYSFVDPLVFFFMLFLWSAPPMRHTIRRSSPVNTAHPSKVPDSCRQTARHSQLRQRPRFQTAPRVPGNCEPQHPRFQTCGQTAVGNIERCIETFND